MRTYDEMMQLIIDKAKNDERIRAVLMNGSRANFNAVHDEYSDFDICYVVTDIRDFTKDKSWITYFGDILIVQYPVDWYSHLYDYNGKNHFSYLIQFQDGNRIDLSLIDISQVGEESSNLEPRMVLLNKDNLKELIPIRGEEAFYIKKPSEMEYYNTCNEFRWLSIYVTKGLCRKEIYYAKYAYDCLLMEMFVKMLNCKIAFDHDFMVTTGDHSKYLKRYLSPEEMERFQNVFPNGTYEDIWLKLFLLYDYFAETAEYVGRKLGYFFDKDETTRVKEFIKRRQTDDKTKMKDMNNKKVTLETDRLEIISKTFKEMQVCFEQEEDPGMKQAYSEMIQGMKDTPEDWIWFSDWTIKLKKSDIVIGGMAYKGPANEKGEVEIGYGLGDEYQGKGYAYETLCEIVKWAFTHPEVKAVMAETLPDNNASQQLLKRVGFQETGIIGVEGPRYRITSL